MKPDEGYGAQNPVFPFPFSPSLIVFLNNIYEKFPRAPRENQVKRGASFLTFFNCRRAVLDREMEMP